MSTTSFLPNLILIEYMSKFFFTKKLLFFLMNKGKLEHFEVFQIMFNIPILENIFQSLVRRATFFL